MEEQVLVNQIKSLIEKEIHGLKTENVKLKKENQELKDTLIKISQLSKVNLECPLQSGVDDKKLSDNYKLIDLDLPSGTLWMDRNVGAKSPTDSGLYFAWGETTGYKADEVGKTKLFGWTDYKYANCAYNHLNKYCNKACKGYYGYTDSLVTLQSTDDAVLQNIHKCQMPTYEQFQELIDNTTYEWTTIDGVNGGLFTSNNNSNSIFVPAAGYCSNGSVDGVGENGYLWSSSLCEDVPNDAWYLDFYSEGVDCSHGNRCDGVPVRGVAKS